MLLLCIVSALFLVEMVTSIQRFEPLTLKLPFQGHKEELEDKILKLRYPAAENTRWYYTGSISDPANGIRVAGIEGLEFLSPLQDFNISAIVPQQKGSNPLSTNDIMPAYISHKVFIYTNETDRSLAKTTFRKNKLAPERKVVNPVNEFVNIVTFGNRISQNVHRSYLVWPSKRFSSGIVRPIDSQHGDHSLVPPQSTNGVTFQHKISANPPRRKVNKWIGFGSSRDNSAKSVEIYSISQSVPRILQPIANRLRILQGGSSSVSGSYRNSPVMIQYRRYGESPAWLAPGRHCEIVINGYKINSIQNIPIATQKLFQEYAPHMLEGTGGVSTLDEFMIADDRSDQYRPWYSQAWRMITRQKDRTELNDNE